MTADEDKRVLVELLDSYFRLTLRLDLDEDIPAAAEEIAALMAEREQATSATERERIAQMMDDAAFTNRECLCGCGAPHKDYADVYAQAARMARGGSGQ